MQARMQPPTSHNSGGELLWRSFAIRAVTLRDATSQGQDQHEGHQFINQLPIRPPSYKGLLISQ